MNPGPEKTNSIEVAANELIKGHLVAIPTETVYGLAADATNSSAVARVFELKGRPTDHPLIVHCGSQERAFDCCDHVTEAARKLAQSFWPGPLTLVLPRAENIDLRITGGQDSVALRVPSHPLTLDLLNRVDRPIVAPSANRFGKVSPTSADHVVDEFAGETLTILDGGPCQVGIESTIVDCRNEENVRVLRPGKITDLDVSRVLGDPNRGKDTGASESVRVSGSLPSHYSPDARVILLEADEVNQWLEQNRQTPRTMLVTTGANRELPDAKSIKQVSTMDVESFARELYRLLRDADKQGFDLVAVELPSPEGIGIAIRDRLQRAAAEK